MLKNKRLLSFIIVGLIYLFGSAVGIITYFFIPIPQMWLKLFVSDVFATIFVFIFSVIFKNASVYDPYWSVQPVVILFAFALMYSVNVTGILILIAISIWAVRLTTNWAYTFKDLSCEDWRYVMLKEKTGKFYPLINFIGIHLVPTIVVYACTMPAVHVILSKPDLNVGAIIFFVVSILAVILQGTADVQMHAFKKKKPSTFIRVGVWKYSRHPNYLAEIIMWWSVGLFTVCVIPSLWYTLLGALLNTLLFLFVSIPMADNRQAKKEGFDEYKSQTHALIPLPKIKK